MYHFATFRRHYAPRFAPRFAVRDRSDFLRDSCLPYSAGCVGDYSIFVVWLTLRASHRVGNVG